MTPRERMIRCDHCGKASCNCSPDTSHDAAMALAAELGIDISDAVSVTIVLSVGQTPVIDVRREMYVEDRKRFVAQLDHYELHLRSSVPALKP